MAFFIVCFALGWMAIGAAINSRLNRYEFDSQRNDSLRVKGYLDDSEFKEVLHKEGVVMLCVLITITIIGWPLVLHAYS